ncbi:MULTISPECIES: hypothetical protein [Morganellaceae]|uniref:Uncharacterized protein n=2 Tax=Moellerella wisconsensis TaxID=158849 RepID=A0A9Q8V5W4_9GAMM|nr:MULTISPECIES: hypothetical protein [Morganellaceae]QCJ72257.1 hypothetical protein C9446_20885 [Providencia heimbachae]UNH29087.1 hypothetical protein MNY64_16185 [Moellerella wisconsensis]UNH32642.1 hypothetical protein MNY72_16595 [Moellerella wisconsensis]UNH40668.1 hypothetical protein MNY70_17680 [Moellerella wisconsensis]UNH44372.1 hypothetical protein MNY66_16625 [Moellerella wisconsensis]
MSQIKPFSWLIRLDVAPLWVADGFCMNNQTALDMLANQLPYADMSFELGAAVIAGPDPRRIVNENGWESNQAEEVKIRAESPFAYPENENQGTDLVSTLTDAIAYIDSVEAGSAGHTDKSAVIARLRSALALVDSSESIVNFEWQPAE